MEKIVGLDLRDYLQHRGKPIDQKLAIHWLTQLVEILQVIHQQHVLHRDIKPANIMLKADGYLALVDFGTARSVTHISGELGTRVVSSFYTPREQMQGQAVPQSDFFALGRTFVFLVTGQDLSTFYDAATDELHWRDAAADISAEFADFLDQLMHPLAGQRPANAEVILQRLTELEGLRHTKTTILLNRLEAPSPPVAPPVRSEHSQTAEETQRSVSSSLSSAESLSPEFVQQCERKLAEFIGPIATIVCQRTFAQMPQLSEHEFVEQLAKKIPKLEAALEFQRYLGTHR
jgi:serine/threonine protein kinase